VASPDPPHVLVVDDDRSVQRMLADALARQGFRVTVEHDGEAALRAFDREPFDAVLLDVLLPVLNGYEVARRIKSSPRGDQTPVLLLSGIYKTRMHQAEAVEKHGAAGFVPKPFKLGQLFGKLQAVLGTRYPLPPPRSPDDAFDAGPEPLADSRAQDEASEVRPPRAARRRSWSEATSRPVPFPRSSPGFTAAAPAGPSSSAGTR
jgi:DNA-binding response OmpR family regulator